MARYTRLPHSETVPLSLHKDKDTESDPLFHDDEYALHLRSLPQTASDDHTLPSYLIWLSVALVCLSTLATVLLPATLSSYSSTPLSRTQLDDLPYPDQHLGLDRVADLLPPRTRYEFSWPAKIARVNQKLKNAVFGNGVDVFISVQDSTIMQFPIPPLGAEVCAVTWTPPPERSSRLADLETKGDITEIEVWSIIAPHHHHHDSDSKVVRRQSKSAAAAAAEIDFDSLSWNTRPVSGELLGTLDLTARPNSTTVEFVCPTDADSLTVEFRCLRVACHVRFKQVHFVPKMGFELLRRQ